MILPFPRDIEYVCLNFLPLEDILRHETERIRGYLFYRRFKMKFDEPTDAINIVLYPGMANWTPYPQFNQELRYCVITHSLSKISLHRMLITLDAELHLDQPCNQVMGLIAAKLNEFNPDEVLISALDAKFDRAINTLIELSSIKVTLKVIQHSIRTRFGLRNDQRQNAHRLLHQRYKRT